MFPSKKLSKKLRSLVLHIIDRESGLAFDLCENAGQTSPNQPDPSSEPSGDITPSWCKCGNCRKMGIDLDNKCCGCLPRNCVLTKDVRDI